MEPTTCFSIEGQIERRSWSTWFSKAGWMLVMTTRPRLAVTARAGPMARPSPTPMVMITLLAMRPRVASPMRDVGLLEGGSGVGGSEGQGLLPV